MILDVIGNASRYSKLHDGFDVAIDFLARADLSELPPEKYEIDGDRVYAIVAKDFGRKKNEGQLEIHRKYIDIQFVVSGVDTMGWKAVSQCKMSVGEYDSEKDIQFFEDEPEVWMAVESGAFAVFFPEDAHLPLISDELIHKVIVKIAV